MTRVDWEAYIGAFHDQHPGITEAALEHARHPRLGTPHEWLAAALPGDCGDTLDLACGSCPMQPLLQYRSYLGIDRNAAELAAARAAGRGPVRQGDVTDVVVPDASVDTVVMSMALMLVPVAATLGEVFRVLRPGGRFAVMVPAMWPAALGDVPAVVALSTALWGPGSMPRTLSPKVLQKQLRAAGLEPLEIQRHRFPFPIDSEADARLAVSSLYTPGRTAGQLRRAEKWLSWLAGLPARTELPVPLLRVVARRRVAGPAGGASDVESSAGARGVKHRARPRSATARQLH